MRPCLVYLQNLECHGDRRVRREVRRPRFEPSVLTLCLILNILDFAPPFVPVISIAEPYNHNSHLSCANLCEIRQSCDENMLIGQSFSRHALLADSIELCRFNNQTLTSENTCWHFRNMHIALRRTGQIKSFLRMRAQRFNVI